MRRRDGAGVTAHGASFVVMQAPSSSMIFHGAFDGQQLL